MSKKPKRQNLRPPRKCIFCGGGDMSKEHFWPEWSHEYLRPLQQTDKHTVAKILNREGVVLGKTSWTRQGGLFVRQIRCVCKTCNSGWMGGLETAAKHVIVPLIPMKPNSLELSPGQQTILAQWIALKTLVAEHSTDSYVTPQAGRTAFMAARTIPASFRIRIGLHGCPAWFGSGFYRQSVMIGFRPMPKPLHGPTKNVQALTFSMGRLLVHVMSSELPKFDMDNVLKVTLRMARLWPPTGEPIAWPPPVIGMNGPGMLATGLDRLTKSGKIKWTDFSE
jgi:hypothetical protein